jgi:PAS domain S-box-containing protein
MDDRGLSGTIPQPRPIFDSINVMPRAQQHGRAAQEEFPWHLGLSAAADGAFAATSDGRIVLWNVSAERIMGYRSEEVLGLHSCDVFARRDSDRELSCPRTCRFCALIKTGEPIETVDVQTKAKGGREIWLNMSTLVLPITNRRDYRVIRMFRDVTAVKDLLALIRARLIGTLSAKDPLGRLTRRETEVLQLMASGATNRMLATRLHVSPATVRNHTHNIFEKLGVPNRVAAITYAISQFLI